MMLDSAYPHHHHMIGYRLFDLGLIEPAIKSYQRALQLDPGRPDTLDLLARAYIKAHHIHGAEKAIDKIAQINPRYPGLPELNNMLSLGGFRMNEILKPNLMEVAHD